MGSTCETDVKIELGPTRLPIWTCAIPAIPSNSDVTFVHSRLSSACSTAALFDSTAAWAPSLA